MLIIYNNVIYNKVLSTVRITVYPYIQISACVNEHVDQSFISC